MGGQSHDDNTGFSPTQTKDIVGIIQNQLSFSHASTPTPQLTKYVDTYIHNASTAAMNAMSQEYSTFGPQVCDVMVQQMYQSTELPNWADKVIQDYEAKMMLKASPPPLHSLMAVCNTMKPATCAEPTTANASLICSKGKCTLQLLDDKGNQDSDSLLIIPNNTIITGDLHLQRGSLMARNIIAAGAKTTQSFQCSSTFGPS
jgi:hypothetical protein